MDVRINGDAVHFTKIAGTEYDGGMNALCELNLTAGKYDIILVKLFVGAEVQLDAELINFKEDDEYEIMWQYSEDGDEFIDIPDAKELHFSYIVDMDNGKGL